MKKLILFAALLLPSCSLISKAEETLDKIKLASDQLTFKVADIDKASDGVLAVAGQLGEKGTAIAEKVEAVKEVVHAADKDANGTISGWPEISALLLGLVALAKSYLTGASAKKATDELYDMHHENAAKIAAKGV